MFFSYLKTYADSLLQSLYFLCHDIWENNLKALKYYINEKKSIINWFWQVFKEGLICNTEDSNNENNET